MTVMNRLVEKLHLEKQTVKEVAYIVLYKQKRILIQSNEENDTGISGEFGDLVVTHMIDELEQADPNLIKN